MWSFFSFSGPQDTHICQDRVDCSFLRDVNGLQGALNSRLGKPGPDAFTLLAGFFRFYGHFDFKRHAACVITGEPQPKRQQQQVRVKNVSYFMDITNPLEPDLNVSANVQSHAVARFQARDRIQKRAQ